MFTLYKVVCLWLSIVSQVRTISAAMSAFRAPTNFYIGPRASNFCVGKFIRRIFAIHRKECRACGKYVSLCRIAYNSLARLNETGKNQRMLKKAEQDRIMEIYMRIGL